MKNANFELLVTKRAIENMYWKEVPTGGREKGFKRRKAGVGGCKFPRLAVSLEKKSLAFHTSVVMNFHLAQG